MVDPLYDSADSAKANNSTFWMRLTKMGESYSYTWLAKGSSSRHASLAKLETLYLQPSGSLPLPYGERAEGRRLVID
jgi:hypothetical protein